jgi:hypothetical protein
MTLCWASAPVRRLRARPEPTGELAAADSRPIVEPQDIFAIIGLGGAMISSDMLLSLPRGERVRIARKKVETGDDTLSVGQIADDFADRRRQYPHERWHGQNLVVLRALRAPIR